MQLYNTLTHSIQEFVPLKKDTVGMYTCGPTVYNFAHIGNLRTYLFEDILKRTLQYNGYKVKHIMNITDVGHLTSDADVGEDKMEKGAKREGKTAWEIAAFYEKAFLNDLSELNIEPANTYPRATEHIKQQIALIKKLEKKGFTYKTVDGIYFDTAKLPDYGAMANLHNQELKAGARIDIGDKKNTTDFALWKFSPPLEKRQMEWPSPWGVGFPGWHIECSAMAAEYLGVPFDIHCGGIDHIPVHHTNEIAQTEAATGEKLANVWMHGEFLLMGSDKMAKSGDNFVTLATLKEKGISPLAYRYLLLQTHYRKQMTFSWEALKAAQEGLNNLYKQALHCLRYAFENSEKDFKNWIEEGRNDKDFEVFRGQFHEAINNDLNAPFALQYLWVHSRINQPKISITAAKFIEADKILGLNIFESAKKLWEKEKEQSKDISEKARLIIEIRDLARQNKDWAKSDELRAELEAMGYEVKDTPNGTTVNKK